MANYKLKCYEDTMVSLFLQAFPRERIGHILADYYEKVEHIRFDDSVVWAIWRALNRMTNYELDDRIRTDNPNLKDGWIYTLLMNSFIKAYNGTPYDIYVSEVSHFTVQ